MRQSAAMEKLATPRASSDSINACTACQPFQESLGRGGGLSLCWMRLPVQREEDRPHTSCPLGLSTTAPRCTFSPGWQCQTAGAGGSSSRSMNPYAGSFCRGRFCRRRFPLKNLSLLQGEQGEVLQGQWILLLDHFVCRTIACGFLVHSPW